MSAAYVYHPNAFSLPWALGQDDVRRFRRWLTVCLAVIALAGIAIPLVTLPEVSREEQEALPPQLARIVLEKPKPVPPPPPPKQEEVKEEPKPEPEKPPEPEVVKEVKPEPQKTVADAREKAAVSGLLAFKDAFADMRESVDVGKLQDTAAIQRGAGEAATIDRSVLTSKHAARSAGVNVAALSRDTGGVALSGRETTRVDAPEAQEGTGGVRERREVDVRRVGPAPDTVARGARLLDVVWACAQIRESGRRVNKFDSCSGAGSRRGSYRRAGRAAGSLIGIMPRASR